MALDGALNSQLFIQALAYRTPVADRSSRRMVLFLCFTLGAVFIFSPTIAASDSSRDKLVRPPDERSDSNSTMDIHDHPVDVAPRDSWRARATASRE